jgi:hypothetical protein
MEKQEGLQSKIWDGYFSEDKDSIMGSWHRCMICNKIPSEIWHESGKFFTIWHCRTCKEEVYKPKNWWQKFWIMIDKKYSK